MHARSIAGATLIELVTTVALVAILAGLAVPSLRETIVDLRVRTTLDQLVSDLHHARLLALEDGWPVALILRADSRGCVVADALLRHGAPEPVPVHDLGRGLRGLCIAKPATLDRVRFDPRGLTTSGACTLSVRRGARVYSVVVSFAGRIRRTY
ncbi:MAG TPA: GspH/FimT family pseudopilin [Longimicrobiaceae bacterium]|nr:GspH/FimT family pseudopilin [Longimicrobiaceae bacterium]